MDPSQQSQANTFREYLPDLSQERFCTMQVQDAHEYVKEFQEKGQPPWLHGLYVHWRNLFQETYHGITVDGKVRDGLFQVQDEGVPVKQIVQMADTALGLMSAEQKSQTSHHIDSPEWRSWSNPEFLLSDKGIRLDEISLELRESVLAILESTLSPEGYQKAIGAMRINHFLGQLVKAPAIMNEFSYNFVLFGQPSAEKPWGFSFYGHHLCLNILLHKSQIVIAPWFTGAEPNVIDDGPYKGTRILETEEALGLKLMQSLAPEAQKEARTYEQLKDPAMPHGRWNHDDQRHLCGAYRDNRIVPYEGILVSDMNTTQQQLVGEICEQYMLYLPQPARQIQLDQIRSWFHETYWSWIGGFGSEDPFYFRIQSPVVIIEFDHHSGVFLNNKEPAKFHIHTLLRRPNRGDYGVALRSLVPRLEQDFVWEASDDC
ncbi:hypothetical protein BU24DRAFT_482150 [Aaosphaeria arxii CBS 175.79]|uniref:DUF3500 domain-containing protein n=1 Tax=Aaosphaeria arxii CBS 175.79 TaxID=1450172 RepID=A0A6A5XP04_9PLEO|nr:uncharacterized protein BU24DRAFT_482150 [Aaosphaeria arxii CBS 175.79]KAF2014636.1 hypothetical protein BU24DRAFT_482150 [Aaosphaeria arxii CBS 175.79]